MERSEREVERLVRDHQRLVSYQVSRYLKRYSVGLMEREDLVSWGMMGLVRAAQAWDPQRTACFSTLACLVIERMIIRGVKREWKPEEAAVTVSLDEPGLREEREISGERFVDRIADDQNLEQELLADEIRLTVRAALQQLSPWDRRLIERRFFEETPLAALAEELGLTRQGVYHRQKSALRQLRAALTASFAAEQA